MVPQRPPAHIAMTFLLLLLILSLTVLLLRSRNAERPTERMALLVIAPLTVILALTQLFAPHPNRTRRTALENGSELLNAEAVRLAEFIASRPETGTVVLLTCNAANPKRDPAFLALRKTLPASLPLEIHAMDITPTGDAETPEDKSGAALPLLDWSRVNWVVVCHRHPAVLRQLRTHPDAGGLRKAVLFVENALEARTWVDSGLADAAVYYEVPPELHARLRSGSPLSSEETQALFQVYSP